MIGAKYLELQKRLGALHLERANAFLENDAKAYAAAMAQIPMLEVALGTLAVGMGGKIQRWGEGPEATDMMLIGNVSSRAAVFASEPDSDPVQWFRAVGAELGDVAASSALDDELQTVVLERSLSDASLPISPEGAVVPMALPEIETDPEGVRMVELLKQSTYTSAYARALQLQALVASGRSGHRNAVVDYTSAQTLGGTVAESLKVVEHEQFVEGLAAQGVDFYDEEGWTQVPEDDFSPLGELYRRIHDSPPYLKPDGWEDHYAGLRSGVPPLLQTEIELTDRELERGVEVFVGNGFRFPRFPDWPQSIEGFGLAARTSGQLSFLRDCRLEGSDLDDMREQFAVIESAVRETFRSIRENGLVGKSALFPSMGRTAERGFDATPDM